MNTTYLDGPSVCGFWGMFESDFGDPQTESPYCRITPSRVGSALMPFHCPRCKSVVDFTDPQRREDYHDTRKTLDNYWCPRCGYRFRLNLVGKPFKDRLSGGVASAVVESISIGSDGLVHYKRSSQGGTTILGKFLMGYLEGCDVLGA